MAVAKVPSASRLVLSFEVGTDDGGRPVFRSQTLPNVQIDAADQDVYDVARALASLQKHPLGYVQRVDEAHLVEQGGGE